MSLKLFFDPFDKADIEELQKVNTLSEFTSFNDGEESLPWKSSDIAIVGVEEYRGAPNNKPNTDALGKIRSQFYQLSAFSKECQIIDLGNLRTGHSLEDTYLRLKEVCEMLIVNNTLPVILGGSHDLDYGQFMAYENLEKIITLLNVDSKFDLQYHTENSAENHIHQILMYHPNYLFEFCHLGYQRYLNAPKVLQTFQKINYEIRSVGQIRNNLKEAEPIIRSADMLSFDISAIKKTDARGNANAPVFGLIGEEACQICWYAGMNEKLTSAGFYEYNSDFDEEGDTAFVIATMIWYFIEGFSNRKEELSFKSNFYIRYIVPLEKEGHSLIFYKSKLSEKWWMEVEIAEGAEERLNRNVIIPCSYQDYETANKGIIPDRWMKAMGKIY